MSKSIHETIISVFRGKSKREVESMCNPNNMDFGVEQLCKKIRMKRAARNKRAKIKFDQKQNAEPEEFDR